ncbi:hypothetical protein NOC27_1387 [Nitrosococcus oceani AFC27]|nr:hypothetical protein NOC27_1387 [Nitrosococcus oceani AFC27]
MDAGTMPYGHAPIVSVSSKPATFLMPAASAAALGIQQLSPL